MPYTVRTHKSPQALADYLLASVSVAKSEDALDTAIQAATNISTIVANGGYFTVIDNPQIVALSISVVAKGNFYTTIVETA